MRQLTTPRFPSDFFSYLYPGVILSYTFSPGTAAPRKQLSAAVPGEESVPGENESWVDHEYESPSLKTWPGDLVLSHTKI